MSARVSFQWLGQLTASQICAAPPPRGVTATADDWRTFRDWQARDPNWFTFRATSGGNIYGFTIRCPRFWPSSQAGKWIADLNFDSPQPYPAFGTVGGVMYVKYALWAAACRGCQPAVSVALPCNPPAIREPATGNCFSCVTAGEVPMIAPDGHAICCGANQIAIVVNGVRHCVPRLKEAPSPAVDVSVYRVYQEGISTVAAVVASGASTLRQVRQAQALPGMPPQRACFMPAGFTRPRCSVDVTGIPALRVVQVLQVLGLWGAPPASLRGTSGHLGQAICQSNFTLKRGDVYRSRWLIGYDPSKNSCDDVVNYLTAALVNAQNSPDWPWQGFAVSLDTSLFPHWPAARTGTPYPTTNFCLLYAQGTWVAPASNRQLYTTIDATQFGLKVAPNSVLVDVWDNTSDPDANKPLTDCSGTCSTDSTLIFDPATGTSSCVKGVPAGGMTVTGNVYRSRWLVQLQPGQPGLGTCGDAAATLQQFANQLAAQPGTPWRRLYVLENPPADWESLRSSVPFEIESGWCTVYIEGTAGTPVTLQAASNPIPAVRVLDFWDHTSGLVIKEVPSPPVNCGTPCTYHPLTDSFTGPGAAAPVQCPANSSPDPTGSGICICDTGYEKNAAGNCVPAAAAQQPPPCTSGNLIFDADRGAWVCCQPGEILDISGKCYTPPRAPTCTAPQVPVLNAVTGQYECVAPAAAPAAAAPVTAAAKPSNTALYVALGALALGALYVVGRGAAGGAA